MRWTRKINGFSLIEVITALVILSVMLPSFYFATNFSLQALEKNKKERILIALDNYISLLKKKDTNFDKTIEDEIIVNEDIYKIKIDFFPTPIPSVNRAEVSFLNDQSKLFESIKPRYFF